MPIRKIQELGSSDGSTTYGISFDRGDLELVGILDELENGGEFRASVNLRDPDTFEISILALEEPPAPTAD